MRFCLVTTFFPPHHFGGDAIFVASLANQLVAHGHQVTVVHSVDAFNLLRGNVQPSPFPVHPQVEVLALRSPWGALSPLGTYLTGTPFRNGLGSILARDFDVIHWHNASLMGAPAAFALGPARAVRLATLHEYWLICPTHILFRDGEAACLDRSCLKCTLRHGRPPQLWRTNNLVSEGLGPIHRFLAPSQFVANKYREHLPNLPLQVLPHFFTPQSRVQAERKGHFLFVGRLEKAKGLHTILPVFAETGQELWVAGAGNQKLEVPSNVRMLGRVPHQELPALYAQARATIVPSICYETFGLVVLESLQQGTPVIVSDYGALPELVARTGGGAVYRTHEELRALLGSISPQNVDLSEFQAERHLAQYFQTIATIQKEIS